LILSALADDGASKANEKTRNTVTANTPEAKTERLGKIYRIRFVMLVT
jgi:hypothetical protein